MAHLAPPTGRDRRREQLLGLALLLIGISMALVAIAGLSHPKVRRPVGLGPVVSGSPRSSTGRPPVATAPSRGARPADVSEARHGAEADPASMGSLSGVLPVVVLQNSGDPQLAYSAAASFTAGGWTVTATGAFDGGILSTAAYYDPAVKGAQAAANALQAHFAGIVRVRPKFAGLPPGPIVVVLTSDYSQGQTTS